MKRRKYVLADLIAQCDPNAAPPADLASWDSLRDPVWDSAAATLHILVADPHYAGIERVMEVLAPLPDGAKLEFLLSRRGSLGAVGVLDALKAGNLEAVLAAAEAFAR